MISLSLTALLSSLGCGLALAGADYFRKAVPLSVPTGTVLFYFLLVQLPLLGIWLAFSNANLPVLGIDYWTPTLTDVAASLAGNALFIVAVRRSALTMVVPLLALIPVLALGLGAGMLGELPTTQQMIGVAVTAAGVFVLYLPPHAGLRPSAVWKNFRAERGALPMVGVAFAWALTAPLDKMAVARAGVALHSVIQVGLLTVLAGLWLVARRGTFRVEARASLSVIGAGITAGASYGLQLVAYSLTLVTFVESLKRVVEIAAALIVGTLIFRERLTWIKAAGILLVATGVPLMLLPAG